MPSNAHDASESPPQATTSGYVHVGSINQSNVVIGPNASQVVKQYTTHTLSGDFSGAVLNIESTLRDTRQQIANLPRVDAVARAELAELLDELTHVLTAVPPSLLPDSEQLAEGMQALIGAAVVEQPNRTGLRLLEQGVKAMMARFVHVAPRVLEIAEQIVSIVANMTRL